MKMSIKTKQIIIIFSLSFLSTIIVSFFGINFSKKLIEENVNFYVSSIHNKNHTSIEEMIKYGDFLLEAIESKSKDIIGTESTDFHSSEFWDTKLKDLDPFIKQIGDMAIYSHTAYIYIDPQLTGTVHDIYYADIDNDNKVEKQNNLDISYFNEDTFDYPYNKAWWFKPYNTRMQNWSLPYTWTFDNNKSVQFISVTRPLIINDTFLGVIGTDINYDQISKILLDYNYMGFSYLINNENQILYHPSFKKNEFIYYENNDIFLNITNKNFDTLFTSIENDIEVLNKITKLSNDWIIGTTIIKEDVLSELQNQFKKVNIILVIILLLNIPLSYKLGSIISSPLIKITDNVNGYNFNHPKIISDLKILRRKDEIGLMAKSINILSNNIFDNLLILKTQNSKLEEEISSKTILKTRLNLINSVMENSQDGIFILDFGNNLVFINKSLKELLEIEDEGQHEKSFTENYFKINKQFLHNMLETQDINFEYKFTSNSNESLFLSVYIRVINSSDESSGNKRYYIGIVKNISTKKKYEEDIDFIKKYDDLTGLPNKVFFKNQIHEYISTNNSNEIRSAYITINIVEFRIINEIFGYNSGNEVLIMATELLKDYVGNNGIISRTNGDEFSIFIFDFKTLDNINSFSEILYNKFNLPFFIEGKDIYAQICMGVSLFPYDSNTVEELENHSLAAINHVKSVSKTGFEFYYDKMSQKNKEKYENIRKLKYSIQENNVINHFQPIMNIEENEIEGFESLARIKENQDIIYPNNFIALAEETNLIIPLGKIIIRNSLEFLKEIINYYNKDYYVNINISYKQFEDPNFEQYIVEMIDKYDINPKLITLELTESSLIKNIKMSKRKISKLENHGLSIAIDDFGTGYSALNYLKLFDIKKIKIDRSFIKDYPKTDDGTLIRTIENLAKDLNITTVVEGIETEKQLEYIKSIGCKKYQGYLLSKAVSQKEIIQLLDEQ